MVGIQGLNFGFVFLRIQDNIQKGEYLGQVFSVSIQGQYSLLVLKIEIQGNIQGQDLGSYFWFEFKAKAVFFFIGFELKFDFRLKI